MELNVKIEKVIVFLTEGMDMVHFHTNLPAPFPEEVDNGNLVLEFKCTANWGENYVRLHFGMEPEVKNIRYGKERR